ncbi:PREDICTED: matrilysin-like [Dinoponera quadriceps]|uniref:Matrilysin-like n=1 Tax=Dinoponera quadriceps TaxID=609295 RepID=A0A6P3Y632_DINQU|nr:PREDICTED: matrilysin-like [Dinoponera quadriceps]
MYPFAFAVGVWCIVTIVGEFNDAEVALEYLRKYGYLKTDTLSMSSRNMEQVLRHALGLFQEYYQISGQGELNKITLDKMRESRCGLPDLLDQTDRSRNNIWPKKHLTWNFHLADNETMKVTQAAFDLWVANSSLYFKRVSLNPDILLSYREGLHTNIDKKITDMCPSPLDGPGDVVAHTSFPNGVEDYVTEVHVDRAELWHIHISRNPPRTHSLLYVIAHEIGHTLGLHHSEHQDSIMFATTPSEIKFPIRLSLDDILHIRYLYGSNYHGSITTTPPTTTAVVTTTTTKYINHDPCALRDFGIILIINNQLYIAYEKYIWSININKNTYEKPIVISDYMQFLPDNFTHLTAAYQKPTGNLMIFADNFIYVVSYLSYELIQKLSFNDFGLPPTARINTAINTNKGRSFVVYNDHIRGLFKKYREF